MRSIEEQPAKRELSEYTKYDQLVLIYILKAITKKEQAETIPHLAREMKDYLGDSYSERTLRRSVDALLELQESESPLAAIIYCIYGGRIRTTDGIYKKYFWEPCLDDASMSMLNGTVISNQFLSEEEKQYLLTRMRTINLLGEAYEDPADEMPISEVPEHIKGELIPGSNNLYIRNTVLLDRGIQSANQIEFTYGIYDVSGNSVDFRKRTDSDGKPRIYRVNPYALFWNDGHYYLLATYAKGYKPLYVKEEGTPIHFRVDRMIGVRILKEISRERVPARLKKYVSVEQYLDNAGKVTGRYTIFDAEKYRKAFPDMRISAKYNPIDCVIETTDWGLQILVDGFGTDFKIQPGHRKHSKDELDYNGRPQTFVEAHLKGVEFENIRDYCLANPEYITPLSPITLVDAVRDKLRSALKKLDRV